MRFAASEENLAFSASLDDLLAAADTPGAARAWARGEHDPGLKVWRALAEAGVFSLIIPERYDGAGATAVDLAVAMERLGYHAVVGPIVESAAVLPTLLTGDLVEAELRRLAAGGIGTVALVPQTPLLLDADVAELALVVRADGTVAHSSGTTDEPLRSVDATRRLFRYDIRPPTVPLASEAVERARCLGAFAVAAQLLGLGRRLKDMSVEYVKTRVQYGHPIGEYQAIKHLLADVATRLELAAPLLDGAAVALAADLGDRVRGVDLDPERDVAAARVACGDAAYLAARTALQVHGAIGYTAEHDLGIYLTKVRALQSAWGTPAEHRATVLRAVSR
jgi:alkylation response protein AidB-like acyl-CoA dehydrogenase